MKTESLVLAVLVGMLLSIVASRAPSDTFNKITVHGFELVEEGTKRVSIGVEPEGPFSGSSVKGTIRMKLGASEEGSI